MAIHYIQLSESRQSICGRNNPNSATVGGWDGVTCKNCLKLKPSMEQQDGLIGLPQDKLRERVAKRIAYSRCEVCNNCGTAISTDNPDIVANQILAIIEKAGYVKLADLTREQRYAIWREVETGGK